MKTVYIGTYTRDEGFVKGTGKGIYYMLQNPEDGKLEMGKVVADLTNPSFVKISKNGHYLFSVSELYPKEADFGTISSFKINPDKSLTQLNKLSTNGLAPCFIEIDKTGNYLFVANYIGGVVMAYKIAEDGKLVFQQKLELENPNISHAHSVNISPDNTCVYINDLGNDKIWIYKMKLENDDFELYFQGFVDIEKGAGPRHFSFSINGKFGYSINELNSTITAFKIENDGSLSEIQTITTLPNDFDGKNRGSEIHIEPNGNVLYASNRGQNSIVRYKIDPDSGILELINFTSTDGKSPRIFTISPDGKFLYVGNKESNTIVGFRIENSTGKLIKIQNMEAPTPVCIEFME